MSKKKQNVYWIRFELATAQNAKTARDYAQAILMDVYRRAGVIRADLITEGDLVKLETGAIADALEGLPYDPPAEEHTERGA